MMVGYVALQWRHDGRDGVSNHQPPDCLLHHLFRHRSKKTSKLRVTGLCEGNSPVTSEFPAQMGSDAEHVSIWWRHHRLRILEKTIGRVYQAQVRIFVRCLHVPVNHDDVIKWKHFSALPTICAGNSHMSPVNSPHKGQWRGALVLSLICAWINGWVNNGEAGDLRRHWGHYDVTLIVVSIISHSIWYLLKYHDLRLFGI